MRMRLDEFLEMNGRVGAVVATTRAKDQLEIVTLQQVPQFARPSRDRRAQTPERFGQEKDYPGHDPGRPLGGWLVAGWWRMVIGHPCCKSIRPRRASSWRAGRRVVRLIMS